MGGCGSCGPNKGTAWTRERLDQLAVDARAEVAAGRSPTRLFARRFSDGVDACGMDDESAGRVAELWLLWGVLEAVDGLLAVGTARTERIAIAVSLLGDSLQCGPTPRMTAYIRYNLGAAQIASTLRHADKDLHLLAAVGHVDVSSIGWMVAGDAGDVAAWDRAAVHLAAVVDGDDGDEELRTAAGRLLGLAYCLSGVVGRSLRVRARLVALDNAVASLADGDPLRDLALASRRSLGAVGPVTRLVGRHEPPLPEEARLLPLHPEGLFRLPPGVLDVLAAPDGDGWPEASASQSA